MASRGVNKVILIGNLGKDPEIKYTGNGAAVCNLTLATSESWTDKTSGEKQERTEWHRIVVFGKLAEICGEYMRKGGKYYLEGSLRTRKWQDQNGQDRYTTEVVADDMQMLDSKGSTDDAPQATRPAQSAPPQRPAPRPAPVAASAADSFDDDGEIPF